MKKILIFSVFLLASVCAAAWGLLDALAYTPASGGRHHVMDEITDGYKTSFLYQLVQKRKNTFTGCVWGRNANQFARDSMWELLTTSFSPWLVKTRQIIQQSGRADEFADLLTWLPQEIRFKRVDCNQTPSPDINLNIDLTSGESGHAMPFSSNNQWKMNLGFGGAGKAVAIHEIGHLLGLADLDVERTRHESKLYSLASVGVVATPSSSIMWWRNDIPNQATTVTCDDVEGLINAIDYVQFRAGETSSRLENGWKSLCGKPYYYLHGRVARNVEELAQIKQQDLAFHSRGNAISKYQGLYQQRKNYLTNQVLPLKTQKEELLRKLPRPLNDEGLLLSAEVHYLRELEHCLRDEISRILGDGSDRSKQTAEQITQFRTALSHSWCAPSANPLSGNRLEQTVPLEADFREGQEKWVHKCAICGQDITPGEEEHREPTFMLNGKKQSKVYYKHKTCPALTSKKALLAYQDHPAVAQKNPPTYRELKSRVRTAEVSSSLAVALNNHVR